jgi:putative transposase
MNIQSAGRLVSSPSIERPEPRQRPVSKPLAITAITVGGALELYDSVVYNFFATLIGPLFFPAESAFSQTLLSFASFASFGIGYVVRPLGGFVIGRYADRVHVLLKREGWKLGRNQAWRLYSEEQLQLRSKLPRRRKMIVQRAQRIRPSRAGEAWAMDFVSDQMADGGKFRILTVVDVYTREALAVEAGLRLRGEHVVEALNRLARLHHAPKFVFVDNGSEFTGRLMDMWAYHHGVRLDFSRPGKPTDNGLVESFNGTLRDECLNLHWFATITEARSILEAWRRDYNESRPHSSLGDRTPAEFMRSIKEMGPA